MQATALGRRVVRRSCRSASAGSEVARAARPWVGPPMPPRIACKQAPTFPRLEECPVVLYRGFAKTSLHQLRHDAVEELERGVLERLFRGDVLGDVDRHVRLAVDMQELFPVGLLHLNLHPRTA